MTTATKKSGELVSTGTMTFEDFPITSMDPRLQRACAARHFGERRTATSSATADEIAVIAKVNDLAAWEGLSEVRVGATIGDQDSDGTWIVTARIPVQRAEAVRQSGCVVSLKASQVVRPHLAATTKETNATPKQLPTGAKCNGGKGAIVGIVDFGCDFAHKNFQAKPKKTRIKAFWHQGAAKPPGSTVPYGRLINEAEFNNALAKTNSYQALGYRPGSEAHGTHVMDIAAGSGGGTTIPGMSPNAEIVFVQVAADDIPWDGAASVGKSFGDSVQLLEAVKFIFDYAGTTPCVVNLSLGTNGGPHDGTTLVEQGLDRLVRQSPNRAVVIAASNSFSDGIHAAGKVTQGKSIDVGWQVQQNDQTSNEFELWYPGKDRITLELIAPDGSSVGKVTPGGPARVAKNGNTIVLYAVNRLNDPNNHDNTIGIYMDSSLPSGKWTVRLHGTSIQDGSFHAWLERDDDGQSSFVPPLNNASTLGSISCGQETIVVGSYDAHKPTVPISFFSSAGPTRDGRQKPEVSAPGHAVEAANSESMTGVTQMSGTSMAAPAVTGLVALVLAEAKARNLRLTSSQIRSILTSTARRNPPMGTAWDSRYGFGRVDAAAAVQKVIDMAKVTPTTAKPSKKPAKTSSTKKKK